MNTSIKITSKIMSNKSQMRIRRAVLSALIEWLRPLACASLLLLVGCEKPALLEGEYVYTAKIAEGTLTTEVVFEDGKYLMDSYILSADRLLVTQICEKQSGTYESRASGYALKLDGQRFYWATHGKVDGSVLVLKDVMDNSKMVFIKQ